MQRIDQELARTRRAEREERGLGRGDEYVGLFKLTRHDFGSEGRSHSVSSLLGHRQMTLLSDLELFCFYYLQLKGCREFRENYPLWTDRVEPEFESQYPDAPGTLSIARSLKFDHPRHSDGTPKRFSTDLLAQKRNFEKVALIVKYSNDAETPWARVSIATQATYWRARGVKPITFSEKDVSRTVVCNMHMLRRFEVSSLRGTTAQWLEGIAGRCGSAPMNQVVAQYALATGVTKDIAVDRVKAACACGALSIDLASTELNWMKT